MKDGLNISFARRQRSYIILHPEVRRSADNVAGVQEMSRVQIQARYKKVHRRYRRGEYARVTHSEY